MNRTLALVAALLLGATSASAQTVGVFMADPTFKDPPPARCDSTLDMERCAAHDLRVADADMARAYRAALAASTAKGAAQALRTAQRTWLAWRDQECPWQGSLYTGGTMAPLVVANCWVAVTKARRAQLAEAIRP